jgi:hypothetical protein
MKFKIPKLNLTLHSKESLVSQINITPSEPNFTGTYSTIDGKTVTVIDGVIKTIV